ncbi:DUF433 domain-containing protein [Thermosynechococcaceae cyanobacterium BACA0444]|uniref:DUF433 domain-containing protein n=1 Tax=Pseudocalidococcus azoricus BACA0444 TaxID=2918990 RepID=A0AAE4FR49_9CYAN|nr:DUF433 domain-containing protein [Pseudocalidococcus azoricus]MDS3860749.1 DUF433 domain-containing protein [Pseudocalidococcus azoricus BACA0444]
MNSLPNLLTRITQTSSQCEGRPWICGMGSRVSDILEMLAENVSVGGILANLLDLEIEDIQARLVIPSKLIED